jgi:hypothetical protein
LVDLCRFLDVQIHGQVHQFFIKLIIHCLKTFLYNLILFFFEQALTHNLDFICFFVSLLSHHTLKLESICLKRSHLKYYYLKSYY